MNWLTSAGTFSTKNFILSPVIQNYNKNAHLIHILDVINNVFI